MRRIRHYGKSTVPAGLPATAENMTLMMPVSGSAAAQLIIRHGLDLTAQRLRQLRYTVTSEQERRLRKRFRMW